ncbi:hypothetical protein TNCV_3179351 [Trichonephila clavipes]|nr:hypothetical protein TNCV_3179351 [Trichonephila clavipes]
MFTDFSYVYHIFDFYLAGEKPAAMQHDANPGHSLSCPFHSHRLIHWLNILLWFILRTMICCTHLSSRYLGHWHEWMFRSREQCEAKPLVCLVSEWPIYDRKVREMLIQSASSHQGLVRNTVVFLEKSIALQKTEQHKRMEVNCDIEDPPKPATGTDPPFTLLQDEVHVL